MKLKYPIHFNVCYSGFYDAEYLTRDGDFRPTSGVSAGTPKCFRSFKAAKAAARKHNATVEAYWLEEGEREYNRLTVFGPLVHRDNVRFLPDIVKTLVP